MRMTADPKGGITRWATDSVRFKKDQRSKQALIRIFFKRIGGRKNLKEHKKMQKQSKNLKKLLTPVLLAFMLLLSCLFPALGAQGKIKTASADPTGTVIYFSDTYMTAYDQTQIAAEYSNYSIRIFNPDMLRTLIDSGDYQAMLNSSNYTNHYQSTSFSDSDGCDIIVEIVTKRPDPVKLEYVFSGLKSEGYRVLFISGFEFSEDEDDFMQYVEMYEYIDVVGYFVSVVVNSILNDKQGFYDADLVIDHRFITWDMLTPPENLDELTAQDAYENSRLIQRLMTELGCADIEDFRTLYNINLYVYLGENDYIELIDGIFFEDADLMSFYKVERPMYVIGYAGVVDNALYDRLKDMQNEELTLPIYLLQFEYVNFGSGLTIETLFSSRSVSSLRASLLAILEEFKNGGA